MLLVDTDNAMGSPLGDVDDGLALAMLLRSGLSIDALSSVGGNTSEERAFRNNRVLGALCGYAGRYLRGVEAGEVEERIDRARDFWSGGPVRIVALGPLTNVAAVLGRSIEEVVLVGGNATSRGRWPPVWPHEFNLIKDRDAARAVFASELPLTIVPLDVAGRLRVGRRELAELEGELGDFLHRRSARWRRRSRWIHGSSSFPAFDLLAAACVSDPSLVEVGETAIRVHPNLWIEFGKGDRRARVVRSFDGEAVWRRFVERINGQPGAAPVVSLGGEAREGSLPR